MHFGIIEFPCGIKVLLLPNKFSIFFSALARRHGAYQENQQKENPKRWNKICVKIKYLRNKPKETSVPTKHTKKPTKTHRTQKIIKY